MSVFQFRKTPLYRERDPVKNTGNFTCDPRQHESTECGFHHLCGVSGILQLLCVGLRTRKSMAFVLNSPRLEICLTGSPVILNLFTEFFIFDISFPLRVLWALRDFLFGAFISCPASYTAGLSFFFLLMGKCISLPL